MSFSKPRLRFWQIINMNVGFFGIQYSFGLQQSAVNPIYDFLGAKPDEIPWLNLAGPLTGLLIQPIIGALSDRTWHSRFGRRKPYFFIGAIMCSLALFAFPFSSSLWMAAGLLWILDAGNNTAMEPYRAFVADKLSPEQQGTGFLSQSFFTGFGQTLANVSLFIFPMIIIGKTGAIPNWVFGSFILGAVCSIGSVWWSMKTTPEIPPTPEELAEMRSKPLNVLSPFTDVLKAIQTMPKIMWMLALVYLFQWYALFCYWQNSSKAVAKNAFEWKAPDDQESKVKTTFTHFQDSLSIIAKTMGLPIDSIRKKDSTYSLLYNHWKDKVVLQNRLSEADLGTLTRIEANDKKYEKAVSWTGLVNAWYNVVTFLIAFGLVWLAKKYSPKWVHTICLLISGAGFIAFAFVQYKWLFFPAITGFGIGWASMMGIPYLMVVSEIPKEKYGVYMGIINMMIVIPMLLQTVSFGYILKHFLNNDSSKAILFAGVLLLVAAFLTTFIKSTKISNEINSPTSRGSGH
jgi:maltose/moltooligosaccharide transporter